MKKLSKDEMKKVVGGFAARLESVENNTCSAKCPGGCVATVVCDGNCSAIDGEGAYCNLNGGGKVEIVC